MSKAPTKTKPFWRAPDADKISVGDIMTYYTWELRFKFEVTAIIHNGEWLSGKSLQDGTGCVLGPICVPRASCMSYEQATFLLKNVPEPGIDAPDDAA